MYTEDRYNDYVVYTSGGKHIYGKQPEHKLSGSNTAPGFNSYWERGDNCGKISTSCACRFGLDLYLLLQLLQDQHQKNSQIPLPFGGFPGARKFK